MKKTRQFDYEEVATIEELDVDDGFLLEEAQKASAQAYAPYSLFRVGAALLLENGAVITGNNQENAAYPSGLCAERVAMFYASSQYPGVPFKALAITANSDKVVVDHPISPCGACRQVMVEYESVFGNPIRVILAGKTGSILIFDSLKDLLPFSFVSDELKSEG